MARQQRHLGEENPPRVTVRMPTELKRKVAQIALDQGRSENDVMVEAIERYVQYQEKAE